jgi:hypothetical protein
MRRTKKPRDLFGKALPRERTDFETSLRQADRYSFHHRLERLRYLESIFPEGMSYMLPPETHFLFEEARMAYVAGLSVAVVLLTQAFIEHYYQLCLENTSYSKIAERGLAAICDCLKKHKLEHEIILKRVDSLRLIRNPFTHLKDFSHPHNLSQRAYSLLKNPQTLLEQDAKDSMDVLFAIIRHSKFRT